MCVPTTAPATYLWNFRSRRCRRLQHDKKKQAKLLSTRTDTYGHGYGRFVDDIRIYF